MRILFFLALFSVVPLWLDAHSQPLKPKLPAEPQTWMTIQIRSTPESVPVVEKSSETVQILQPGDSIQLQVQS